jgi:hypothetical protein
MGRNRGHIGELYQGMSVKFLTYQLMLIVRRSTATLNFFFFLEWVEAEPAGNA